MDPIGDPNDVQSYADICVFKPLASPRRTEPQAFFAALKNDVFCVVAN